MKKMKICHFVKVLILYPLIFFANTSTTTYAQTVMSSPTFLYKSNVHTSKTNKFVNNLSLKKKASTVNYDELIVVSCSNDLDGDNLKESIELIYNGDFILKIDDKHIIVKKNVYYCPRNISLCPNLDIVDEFHDKYKIIIISYSEATHPINPTVETWFYQYKNKEINQRDSLSPL